MSDKKKKEWNVEDEAEKAGKDIERGLKDLGEAAEKAGEDIERELKKGWEKAVGARAKDTVAKGKDKNKKDD